MNVTILLATYNGEKYIKEQLDSLLSQAYTNFEILVRDDGSTDGTMKLIEEFQAAYPEKIKIIESDAKNLGSSKSFMTLLEDSDAEYIMFCDQDDVWLPQKVEWTLKKMLELENIYGSDVPLLVFTDMKVVDSKLSLLYESFWKYQELDPVISADWKKLLAQNVVTGCTVMINQAAKKISLPYTFEEMLHDHWVATQVAKYGKIGYVATPTLLYRQHDSNVEGAHRFGWRYVVYKLKTIVLPLQKLYRSSVVFSEVSFSELLIYKFKINIKRLLKR